MINIYSDEGLSLVHKKCLNISSAYKYATIDNDGDIGFWTIKPSLGDNQWYNENSEVEYFYRDEDFDTVLWNNPELVIGSFQVRIIELDSIVINLEGSLLSELIIRRDKVSEELAIVSVKYESLKISLADLNMAIVALERK